MRWFGDAGLLSARRKHRERGPHLLHDPAMQRGLSWLCLLFMREKQYSHLWQSRFPEVPALQVARIDSVDIHCQHNSGVDVAVLHHSCHSPREHRGRKH